MSQNNDKFCSHVILVAIKVVITFRQTWQNSGWYGPKQTLDSFLSPFLSEIDAVNWNLNWALSSPLRKNDTPFKCRTFPHWKTPLIKSCASESVDENHDPFQRLNLRLKTHPSPSNLFFSHVSSPFLSSCHSFILLVLLGNEASATVLYFVNWVLFAFKI